jgi:hypothetical protein
LRSSPRGQSSRACCGPPPCNFIVAATQIGLQAGVITRATAAALVAAGLLSVVISPALGRALLRRERVMAAG